LPVDLARDILAPMKINETFDHIYLSPHLDDAVLSCGGLLACQSRAGERALVVTFFAASPTDAPMTDFSRELQERWGDAAGPADDPVAVRREEDLQALRRLGVEGVHLPFLDCVFRVDPRTGQSLYPSEEAIFGEVHPAERGWEGELLEALYDAVGNPGQATIYAPVTAGHHVDHILVRRVAIRLLQQGYRVLFYEDYPYAGDESAVAAARADWPDRCWSARARFYDDAALYAKGDAVACYASQISTFWCDLDEMRRALGEFGRLAAAAHPGGCADPSRRYAETYWLLAPECVRVASGIA